MGQFFSIFGQKLFFLPHYEKNPMDQKNPEKSGIFTFQEVKNPQKDLKRPKNDLFSQITKKVRSRYSKYNLTEIEFGLQIRGGPSQWVSELLDFVTCPDTVSPLSVFSH